MLARDGYRRVVRGGRALRADGPAARRPAAPPLFPAPLTPTSATRTARLRTRVAVYLRKSFVRGRRSTLEERLRGPVGVTGARLGLSSSGRAYVQGGEGRPLLPEVARRRTAAMDAWRQRDGKGLFPSERALRADPRETRRNVRRPDTRRTRTPSHSAPCADSPPTYGWWRWGACCWPACLRRDRSRRWLQPGPLALVVSP